MQFNQINAKKVYEQIIDQIKEMIYNGQLKKGDKLPSERTLTTELGVSRASIREAFSALEMIGLIESRHGEGTFIKENTEDYFLKPLSLTFMLEENVAEELIELRKMIEVSNVKLAARRASSKDIEEIGKYVKMIEFNPGNAEIYKMADKGFHYALAWASGNKLISKLLNSISEVIDINLTNTIKIIVEDENKIKKLIEQHKKIFEAISQGDELGAQKAMEEHLSWAEELLIIRN